MNRAVAGAFASVVTLFFAWGFVSANNDPLVAAMRATFRLSWTEALLTQIASFVAFGLVSLPAAALVQRIGPVRAIVAALGAMIAGCLIVQLSRWVHVYPVVLAGIFVLAGGVAALQVAANPLAAALGPPGGGAFRLTLAQSFNSLGVVCGVSFGAQAMLGDSLEGGHGEALAAVTGAYLAIAALLLGLIAFLWAVRRPIDAASGFAPGAPGRIVDALRSRWALAGAGAIALYVGAEVSIGSVMINFLADPARLGVPLERAGFYLALFYWGGALAGRFLGAIAMIRAAAARLLAVAAAGATLLCALAALGPGFVAAVAALAIGFCNAIMFPVIFALTLDRARAPHAAVSGLLSAAIVGGALVPLLVGQVADRAGLAAAFGVPLLAYAYVLGFALACTRSSAAAAAGS